MTESHHRIDADVIVVGAGVSGMTTCLSLLEREPTLNVMVLEGNECIGGRAFATPCIAGDNGVCRFDIGGQWFSDQQEVLVNLIKRLGLTIKSDGKPAHDSGLAIVELDGKSLIKEKHKIYNICGVFDEYHLMSYVTKIENLCQQNDVDASISNMNMELFIVKNVSSETVRSIARHLILRYCGLPANHVSVPFYVFFCISTHGISNQLENHLREFYIEHGAQQICTKIAKLVGPNNVITNHKVTTIIHSQHEVTVKTKAKTYYSYHVVVAIPPENILEIDFSPPLNSYKVQCLTRAVKGTLIKFIATYNTDFWRSKGLSGEVIVINKPNPTRPLLCCSEVTMEADKPALCGFLVGHSDSNMNFVENSKVLLQLREYFGRQVQSPVQFVQKNWTTGSPMCCFHNMDDLEQIREITGRIVWAGAETASDWYGTLAGAVQSGNRAALQVLYELRPALLTAEDNENLLPFVFTRSQSKQLNTYHSFQKNLMNRWYALPGIAAMVYLTVKMYRKGYFHKIINSVLRKILQQPIQ